MPATVCACTLKQSNWWWSWPFFWRLKPIVILANVITASGSEEPIRIFRLQESGLRYALHIISNSMKILLATTARWCPLQGPEMNSVRLHYSNTFVHLNFVTKQKMFEELLPPGKFIAFALNGCAVRPCAVLPRVVHALHFWAASETCECEMRKLCRSVIIAICSKEIRVTGARVSGKCPYWNYGFCAPRTHRKRNTYWMMTTPCSDANVAFRTISHSRKSAEQSLHLRRNQFVSTTNSEDFFHSLRVAAEIPLTWKWVHRFEWNNRI